MIRHLPLATCSQMKRNGWYSEIPEYEALSVLGGPLGSLIRSGHTFDRRNQGQGRRRGVMGTRRSRSDLRISTLHQGGSIQSRHRREMHEESPPIVVAQRVFRLRYSAEPVPRASTQWGGLDVPL